MVDRRTASVGLTVDLLPLPTINRQTDSVGLNVDLKVIPSATVSASQSTTISLQIVLTPGGTTYPRTGSAIQATQVSVRRASTLTRTLSQPIAVNLVRQWRLTRATAAVAQSASIAIGRGYQRVVSAIQSTAVSRQRQYRLTRATTGNRRVSMSVSLGRVVGRVLRVTRPTSVRLVRQIRLTRAVTQGHAVALAGVPVQLRVVAAIQTRSLALGRAIALVRSIVQTTAVYLPSGSSVERTIAVPTVLSRQQDVSLTRAVAQAQSVSLEVRDLTPLLELIVSTTVGQSLSISSAGAGGTAREFVVGTRQADFVVGGRTGQFSAARRGVRFTVESR